MSSVPGSGGGFSTVTVTLTGSSASVSPAFTALGVIPQAGEVGPEIERRVARISVLDAVVHVLANCHVGKDNDHVADVVGVLVGSDDVVETCDPLGGERG